MKLGACALISSTDRSDQWVQAIAGLPTLRRICVKNQELAGDNCVITPNRQAEPE